LRGAGRQMMDRDGQTALISQPLQLSLPQPHPHAVRAAPIGRDGQALGPRIARSPDLLPPAPDGLPRKGCRVMVLAHPDPAGIGGQIINAIRHRPPQLLDLACRLKPSPCSNSPTSVRLIRWPWA